MVSGSGVRSLAAGLPSTARLAESDDQSIFRTIRRRLSWLHRLLILSGLQGDAEPRGPLSRPSQWGTSPRFLRWFLWIQILLGWLLATLFLAGVTGIVRTQ